MALLTFEFSLEGRDPKLEGRSGLRAQSFDFGQSFIARGGGLTEHGPEMHDLDLLGIMTRMRLLQEFALVRKPVLLALGPRLKQADEAQDLVVLGLNPRRRA